MPPQRPVQVEVQFPAGERYAYGVVPFRRIEIDVPSKPGLYSWHIRIPRTNAQEASAFLHKLFVNSTLEVTAYSNLRQTWQGPLKSTVEPFENLENVAFQDFFFALAYPLYIGISRNLSARLMTHKKELTRWRAQDAATSSDLFGGPFESDSPEESRTFGRRLGAIFRESGFSGTDWLYVKHYTPTHCSLAEKCRASAACLQDTMQQLGEAERTFNTLFHPALGRR